MVKPLLNFLYSVLKVKLQKGNLAAGLQQSFVQRGSSSLQKGFSVQRGAGAKYKWQGDIFTTIFVVKFPSYKSVQQELDSSVLEC